MECIEEEGSRLHGHCRTEDSSLCLYFLLHCVFNIFSQFNLFYLLFTVVFFSCSNV